jgi:hypothetical protein
MEGGETANSKDKGKKRKIDLTSLTSDSLEKMSKTVAVAKFQAYENESIIKDGSWSNVPPVDLQVRLLETGCNSRGLRAGDRDSAYGIVRVGGVCESVVLKKGVDFFFGRVTMWSLCYRCVTLVTAESGQRRPIEYGLQVFRNHRDTRPVNSVSR